MKAADKPDFMASVASDMPLKCLSIRQPWAWAIVHSNKRHENRSWGGWNNHQKRFRGPFCIHASSGMTRYEYDDAKDFMARLGVICPAPNELVRGAVIGTARIVDWVTFSHNAWSVGQCSLGAHASCAVDPDGPQAHLLAGIRPGHPFDAGFHCDTRGGSPAEALADVMRQALDYLATRQSA